MSFRCLFKNFKNLVLLLMLHTAQVGAAVSIVNVNAASQHISSTPWSGKFKTLDGAQYNVSHYYEPENFLFSGDATLSVALSDSLELLIPLSLDAGYRSSLFQTKPFFSAGLGLVLLLDSSALVFTATNIGQVGGETSERPCVDELDRKFHCGLGIPWSDYNPIQPDVSSAFRLAFTLRF